MGSSDLEMSLDKQIPVIVNQRQMSGGCGGGGGPQCGLTSLLPMSCRGRAAAFARDLHSRLRNLGADDPAWLTDRPAATVAAPRPVSLTNTHDETFYDFELECESPSSPVDEDPFIRRSPTDDAPPFYDVDSEPVLKDQARQTIQNNKMKNGFKLSTSFCSDTSPVKVQPSPRENGHADKRLFSAMTFEGVARQNSLDETDCPPAAQVTITDRLQPPEPNSVLDSDSEFESARSEPSEATDEIDSIESRLENTTIDSSTLTDLEIPSEDAKSLESIESITNTEKESVEQECNQISAEVTATKETSPVVEVSILNDKSQHDDEEEDDKPQRVRRCSSLKTGKTPPGTPGRKKIVRFADVLGLDLADVKTFLDEIPVIPKSAYDDLTGCDVAPLPPTRAPQRLGSLTLVPLFQLPRDLTAKLETQNVCLESARVCDGVHVTVCGAVCVRNLDFHKTVHVRYTMNRWRTFTDLQAAYVQGSCDGYSDRFQFVLYAPCIASGQRLELAVRFQAKGHQYWDNNNGANYCFDCLALGSGPPSTAASLHPTMDWHPSFY